MTDLYTHSTVNIHVKQPTCLSIVLGGLYRKVLFAGNLTHFNSWRVQFNSSTSRLLQSRQRILQFKNIGLNELFLRLQSVFEVCFWKFEVVFYGINILGQESWLQALKMGVCTKGLCNSNGMQRIWKSGQGLWKWPYSPWL